MMLPYNRIHIRVWLHLNFSPYNGVSMPILIYPYVLFSFIHCHTCGPASALMVGGSSRPWSISSAFTSASRGNAPGPPGHNLQWWWIGKPAAPLAADIYTYIYVITVTWRHPARWALALRTAAPNTRHAHVGTRPRANWWTFGRGDDTTADRHHVALGTSLCPLLREIPQHCRLPSPNIHCASGTTCVFWCFQHCPRFPRNHWIHNYYHFDNCP